jgi:hypothetical protein
VKRVVAVKTEPRCDTCKLTPEKRAEVDEWIGRLGDESDLGTVTWTLIRERVWPVLTGGETAPSETSLKRHRSQHCRVVEVGDEAAEDALDALVSPEETAALFDEIDGLLEGGMVSPSGVLTLQLRAWLISLRRKLARGEEVNLTPDQAQRAATQLIRAERQEGEAELLRALGGGISQVFEAALSGGSKPAELGPGIIIVDVDEDAEEAVADATA